MFGGELIQAVGAQALTLLFRDVFTIMAAMFVLALVLLPFARTAILRDGPPAPEH